VKVPLIRTLPERPDLDQLRRQAKELFDAFRAGEPVAAAEVNAYFGHADAKTFALHDAQLVLARSYGLDSWPKLKARVDGVTTAHLCEAVQLGDTAAVRGMLRRRPEIVNLERPGHGEQRALHLAVLRRDAAMVRLLMENGADARAGIWPYRNETRPLTLATERGYHEIAAIIQEEEQRRPNPITPVAEEIAAAIRDGDEPRMIALLEANPAALHLHLHHNLDRMTPLHAAAAMLWERTVAWLLEHGADVNARGKWDATPLEVVGLARGGKSGPPEQVKTVSDLLLARGAERSANWAVANGDADWLRARHADGGLEDPEASHRLAGDGLLTLAVRFNRPEILALLLDLGLDPDERKRESGVERMEYSWGRPLVRCAQTGKVAMAEMLLARGADPNAWEVVWSAYRQRDAAMIRLLEEYGGVPNAATPGYLRDTELARRMFAAEDAGRLPKGTVQPGNTVAEEVLDPAASAGADEVLRIALSRIGWPRDDPRWWGILASPLCFWHEIPWIKTEQWQMDRSTYLVCFRLVLERCHGNVCGRFGMSILHYAAASYDWVLPEERVSFAATLLDAGASTNVRDDLLKSTPLGWACRWGRVELVKLLLDRGADSVEADAEPWATPEAWAKKMGHDDVLAVLREHRA
jgi:ankyrin repeat protein